MAGWRSICAAVALAGVAVLLGSASGSAQQPPLPVLVDESVRSDPGMVRAAIGAELGREVVGPGATTIPRVEVRATDTLLVVRWVPEEGYAIERSVPWPADDAAVARTAAMLVANLVRDQAGPALEALIACPEVAPPPPVEEAPPVQPDPPPDAQLLADPLGDSLVVPPPPTDSPDAVADDELEPAQPHAPLEVVLALLGAVGGMVGASPPLVAFGVEAGVRWRELLVGLHAAYIHAEVDAFDSAFSSFVVLTNVRIHLLPTLAFEPAFGPVRLHFGGALGLAIWDYTSISGPFDLRAYGRTTLGASIAATDWLEIGAQLWVGSWFSTMDPGFSFFLSNGTPFDGGGSLAARFVVR